MKKVKNRREIDNAETMVNQAFLLEPEAIVTLIENGLPVAVFDKEGWRSDILKHIREKCRKRKAPETFKMGEIPIIGTVIKIDITEDRINANT